MDFAWTLQMLIPQYPVLVLKLSPDWHSFTNKVCLIPQNQCYPGISYIIRQWVSIRRFRIPELLQFGKCWVPSGRNVWYEAYSKYKQLAVGTSNLNNWCQFIGKGLSPVCSNWHPLKHIVLTMYCSTLGCQAQIHIKKLFFIYVIWTLDTGHFFHTSLVQCQVF